ncbi:MAG: FAD:protein FMN transferase [Prevotella sp.]|nr:FAD:protein FMN transferase [Prevotella sp.]
MAGRFFCTRHTIRIFFLSAAVLLCSCSLPETKREASSQDFVFDTYMQMTVYGIGSDRTCGDIGSLFGDMSAAFDMCYDNDANELPENMLYDECLARTQDLNRLYGDGINLFCGALTELWGISTESPRVPSDGEIAAVLENIPEAFSETVPDGVKLDFGAVAKGYACDKAFGLLQETDTEYAVISLGSSILVYGSKPGGKPFRTGLTDPFGGESYAGIIETDSAFISTSGGYERYFVSESGERFCHIMDMATGRPAVTDIASATVIVPSDTPNGGIMSDFLATVIFAEGSENLDKWLACGEFEVIAITEDGRVRSNCKGFELDENGGLYFE